MLDNSPLWKREENWAEFAFAKTSGGDTGDVPVSHWPIFSVSTVTVPEFFAKVNSASSLLVSKVAIWGSEKSGSAHATSSSEEQGPVCLRTFDHFPKLN